MIGAVLAVGIGTTAFVVTRDEPAEARSVAPPTHDRVDDLDDGQADDHDPAAPDSRPGSARRPYADVPIVQIGSITIPKINLVHPIFEGVWLTVVDHGPGHWPGSAMPGRRGNTVFAGHRVTHDHPFMDLDLLAPGDQVIFHMAHGTFTYAITSIKIVQPEDLNIIFPTPKPTITLFACHPKHSAAQRIVVTGTLIHSALNPKASSDSDDCRGGVRSRT